MGVELLSHSPIRPVSRAPSRAPTEGVGLPALPSGYAFVVDEQGRYYVDASGNYYIIQVS